VTSSRIVDASASVIFPCTIKPGRWHVVLDITLQNCGKDGDSGPYKPTQTGSG